MKTKLYLFLLISLFVLSSCSSDEPDSAKPIKEVFQFAEGGEVVYSADAQNVMLPLFYVESGEQYKDLWRFDTIEFTDNASDGASMMPADKVTSWYCQTPWAELIIGDSTRYANENTEALYVTLAENDTPHPRHDQGGCDDL